MFLHTLLLAVWPVIGALALSPDSTVAARSWDEASQLASAFSAELTLREKAYTATGWIAGPCDGNILAIPRLNFTGLCLHDGPAGIRVADLATLFPASITAGASWDRDLLYARGYAMGEEFREKGAHVILGPVAGPLGRHPLGGRNWEGFAADPYLSGIAMDATIRGHQDAGVQACAKHFIGNEQETQRSSTIIDGIETAAISSNIDDRTLHELYLWPFANSVKAGTSSIMCSYNRLNETYTCEHDHLLNDILKEELGFQGYIMSDWFATHAGVDSVNAGLDMTMPGPLDQAEAEAIDLSDPLSAIPSWFGLNLTAAVNNGSVSEDRLDDMVHRIMTPYYYLGQDQDYPSVDLSNVYLVYIGYGLGANITGPIPVARDVRDDHGALVREIAAAGTVLLKNENSILPIKNITNIAVFGNDAPDTSDGLYFMGDVQNPARPLGAEYGPLAIGGGSGAGRTSDLISPLRAIRERGYRDGFRTQYITDNDFLASGNFTTTIFPIPDVCVVFLKTFASEGWDRVSLENDWNSTYVVEQVAGFCPNKTVVVTHSAGVNTLPWDDQVAAVVAAHYPGEQAGNSLVDILWGDVSPSGHLPYTIPKKASDYDFPIVNITGPDALEYNAWHSNFTEGLFIDYRHFDAHNITPLYSFGHGLSYTTFDIATDALEVSWAAGNVSALPAPASTVSPGGNPALWDVVLNVTATVSNTGGVAGAAVPQLYVGLPTGENGAPAGTPRSVLRRFEKVKLEPGASVPVTFSLARRDVSFWSVEEQEWRVPQGDIRLDVGFSFGDIRASVTAQI
ncbi:beta-glucosidase [Pestalotiopsis sp. NC0098]|nr:beta-glucosidase [Pestalotiopsis sp. NC0098]